MNLTQVKTKKNISKNALGTTHGRVHMGNQKINTIQTRKMKGLKKTMVERKAERKRRATENGETDPKKSKTDGDGGEA